MPVVSGFELAAQIRANPKHENTPIIFLTSEGTRETLAAAVQAGACDLIIKPIDEAVLRERLAIHTADYLLRRHRQKR